MECGHTAVRLTLIGTGDAVPSVQRQRASCFGSRANDMIFSLLIRILSTSERRFKVLLIHAHKSGAQERFGIINAKVALVSIRDFKTKGSGRTINGVENEVIDNVIITFE